MDLVEGNSAEIKNPLGTSFDLADLYISPSPEKLQASRFYHSWGDQDETDFRTKLGIWLPDIIRDLANRHCQNTGRGNFITIEVIEEDGTKYDYEIYFSVRKQGAGKPLELFVETAFIRTVPERFKTKRKKIRFTTIVYNVKNGIPIRA